MASIFDKFFPQQGSRGVMPASDPGEARSLALLGALGPMEQAGTTRTAGPVGSIAQNLIPILGAMIQGKALEKQSALQQMLMQAQIAKAGGNPEEQAAKIRHLNALASSEEALASTRKGQQDYQAKQKELLDKLMGGGVGATGSGDSAGMPSGMKPKVTYGATGPSISFSSDVLSPEAVQQRKDIAAAGSSVVQQRETDVAKFKQQLAKETIDYRNEHPKMGEKEVQTITSAKSLIGVMETAQDALSALKDVDPNDYAKQASNYQIRAEHPLLANVAKSKSFGLVNFDSDPKLDSVFSLIGQTKSALAQMNMSSMRGGIQTLNFLQDHFPGYADTPEQASRKISNLLKDKSIVRQRLQDVIDFYEKRGTMLEAPGAVDHPINKVPGAPGVAWMGRAYVTKSGEKRNVWLNPDTSESQDLPEGQMPNVPDLGIK